MLVLDGGLGTELERRGEKLTGDDGLWSARLLQDDPGALEKVHGDFFRAGCDVVTTASYQFSFEAFRRKGASRKQAETLLRSAPEVVKRAAEKAREELGGRTLRVAASLGSFGATLSGGQEFTGDFGDGVTEELLASFHTERLHCLVEPPIECVAFYAFETIPCMKEARAICTALKNVGGKAALRPASVWLSVTCKSDRLLGSGEEIIQAVRVARESGVVDLFGINCTDPRLVSSIVQHILPELGDVIGLVLYPNKGETYADREWKQGSGATDEDFAKLVEEWILLGKGKVRIVGGCCRTTVDTLANVAQVVKR